MIFMSSLMNAALTSNIAFMIDYMIVRPHKIEIPYCNRKVGGPNWTTVVIPNYGPRYDWSHTAILQLESVYFYGVAITCLPAGILAEWLGPKNTICFPLLIAAAINVLSAIGAKWGWIVPVVCRFIVGLASGMVYPSMMNLIAQWAPPNEIGKFIIAVDGRTLGSAVVFLLSRYMTRLLTWPWTFYFISIMISVHSVLFWFLTSNNPEDHPCITPEEIKYIRTSQGNTVSKEKQFPPFRTIITSSHCWAMTILTFGVQWGLVMQTNMVPAFIKRFMGVRTDESVILTLVPLVVRFSCSILFGNLSDFILSKKLLSRTMTSKIFVISSNFLPALIMMSLGSTKCDVVAATSLFTLTSMLSAAIVGANLRGPLDLSPNFAGTVYGFMLFISQLNGFMVPALGNWILSYNNGIVGWTIIFLIAGGASFATGLIYVCFGSAEIQRWNTKISRKPLVPNVS